MLVHKGKWGFHPCDKVVFQKLKSLNKLAVKAKRQAATWRRWDRKEPQNRVMRPRIRNSDGQVIGYQSPIPMPEPNVLSLFYEKTTIRAYVDKRGKWHKEGFDQVVLQPKACLSQIVTDYYNARHPVAEEKLVKPLSLAIAEIDALCA